MRKKNKGMTTEEKIAKGIGAASIPPVCEGLVQVLQMGAWDGKGRVGVESILGEGEYEARARGLQLAVHHMRNPEAFPGWNNDWMSNYTVGVWHLQQLIIPFALELALKGAIKRTGGTWETRSGKGHNLSYLYNQVPNEYMARVEAYHRTKRKDATGMEHWLTVRETCAQNHSAFADWRYYSLDRNNGKEVWVKEWSIEQMQRATDAIIKESGWKEPNRLEALPTEVEEDVGKNEEISGVVGLSLRHVAYVPGE